MRIWLLIPVLFFPAVLASSYTFARTTEIVYSSLVEDSFLVVTDIPEQIPDSVTLIVYLDADLRNRPDVYRSLGNTIFRDRNDIIWLGIGHTGGHLRKKRRRDFIPSEDAEMFTIWMINDVLNEIESEYNIKEKIITGHSLGGVYVTYLAALGSFLNNYSVFDYHIALSPSLWVNNYSILKTDTTAITKDLFICAGGLEIANQIKRGVKLAEKSSKFRFATTQFIRGKSHRGTVTSGLTQGLVWYIEKRKFEP